MINFLNTLVNNIRVTKFLQTKLNDDKEDRILEIIETMFDKFGIDLTLDLVGDRRRNFDLRPKPKHSAKNRSLRPKASAEGFHIEKVEF